MPILEAAQSAASGANPQTAITAFDDGGDTVIEQLVGMGREPSIVELTQTAIRADPDGTILTLPDRVGCVTGEAFL
jgi:hypothetical protein